MVLDANSSKDILDDVIQYAKSADAPQPYGKNVVAAFRSGNLTTDLMPYVIAHLLARLDQTT